MNDGAPMRRFYENAGVAPGDDGYAVLLDARPIRTPAGSTLAVPTRALAEAIASEWQDQGETINLSAMTLTKLAGTAVDRILPDPAPVSRELARYAETDLLCYRAESPPELAERQAESWQPLLDWFETRFAAKLVVTRGVMPVPQPQDSVTRAEAALAELDGWRLAGLGLAVPASGSLVVGLALVEERLDGDTAFDVSQLDESFQIELWGEDSEATRRRDALRRDLDAAARFIALSRP